jgi:DNA-binding PadR family transcriptional regulator
MNEKISISTLSLAILGLIAQKSRSGYDLRKVFSTTPMGHFSSSPGAIYPALKRIEKSGWIRGSIDNNKELRPRMVYRITAKGLDMLKQHLRQTVTKDDVIWRMDDLMLRFAFMDEVAGREYTLKFLQEFLAETKSYLCTLRQYQDQIKGTIPATARLAMENGINNYQMNVRWAERAIEKLTKDS